MARNDIRIDQLAAEITRALAGYTSDVENAIAVAVDQTARECLAEVKARSPRGPTRQYYKGWKIVRQDGRGYVNRIIWNPKFYGLVHLLEKGHAKRGGGRVEGRPHVGPAEQRFIQALQMRVESIIRNGG